jgi:multidrug efflux pump subunit AcrA (membrane-fusion protein)
MKRIITHGLIAVVLVATVALLVTLGAKWNRREHANPAADHVSIPVTVTSVIRHEFRDEITGVGTLKAKETVLLSPKVPGNVEAVLVDIGDRVEKDQVVVRLDRTTFELAVKQVRAAYASAEAAIAQAKAQLARAEKEYGRASTLMAERVIAQSSFDAAEAAYKTAREALTAAGEQCNQAWRSGNPSAPVRGSCVLSISLH